MKIIFAVLLFGSSALSCEIPLSWTIRGDDPCKIMDGVIREGRELDSRIWFDRGITQGLDYKPIDWFAPEFENLDIVAEYGSFECGLPTSCIGIVYFNPDGRLTLRYGKQFGILRVLLHELGHVVYYRRGYNGYMTVGHGGPDDPYIQAVNRTINFLWPAGPGTIVYFPGTK